MDKNPSNTLLALLAGVAIGAGLGILFAPDSGEKTRRKIKDGVDEVGDELQQQLHALSQKVRTSVAAESEHLSELVGGLAAEAGSATMASPSSVSSRSGRSTLGTSQRRSG